jgi:hypothetical protein
LLRGTIALADRVERAAGLAVQPDQEIGIDLVAASECRLLLLHPQEKGSGAPDRPTIALPERVEPADLFAQGKDKVFQAPSMSRPTIGHPV